MSEKEVETAILSSEMFGVVACSLTTPMSLRRQLLSFGGSFLSRKQQLVTNLDAQGQHMAGILGRADETTITTPVWESERIVITSDLFKYLLSQG